MPEQQLDEGIRYTFGDGDLGSAAVRRSEVGFTSGYLKVVNLALDVLSRRVLVLLSMLLSALLFGWAMWDPDIIRVVLCGMFAGFIFLPTLFKKENDE